MNVPILSLILDIILVIVTIYGLIWGIRKGFIGIFVLVVGIASAILISTNFTSSLAEFFLSVGVSKDIVYLVSFVFIILVVFLIFYIIYMILKRFIEIFRIGWINKTLGAILGAITLFISIGTIYYILSKTPVINLEKTIEKSLFSKYSVEYANKLLKLQNRKLTIPN